MLDPKKLVSEESTKLNKMFWATFKTASGKAVLNHLKQISIYSIGGPEIKPDSLMHIEGQRFIVAEIQNRIEQGKGTSDE